MKVAVSSTGNQLESLIDPRFGRCAYFLVVETDDMSFEAFDNQSVALGGGAGIQSAQFIASKGVVAVITGNCGPNAMRALSAARVKVVLRQTGTVREAAERFRTGDLQAASESNVGAHYGMGMGGGLGRGMGMGRGMGRGTPRKEQGFENLRESGSQPDKQELQSLKEQAEDLVKKMQEIQERLSNIEAKRR
jgi:predicted Fe-Mo cluster-binding NifX family protein